MCVCALHIRERVQECDTYLLYILYDNCMHTTNKQKHQHHHCCAAVVIVVVVGGGITLLILVLRVRCSSSQHTLCALHTQLSIQETDAMYGFANCMFVLHCVCATCPP